MPSPRYAQDNLVRDLTRIVDAIQGDADRLRTFTAAVADSDPDLLVGSAISENVRRELMRLTNLSDRVAAIESALRDAEEFVSRLAFPQETTR